MTLLEAPQLPPSKLAPAADIELLDRNTVLDVIKGGTKNDVNVRDMVIDITIERTIAGASTVTFILHDPDRKLLTSSSLATAIQILFDGYGFRLFSKKKQGPVLTLVFEDHVISWLRQKKKLVTGSRADMTRVQFCIRLCRILKRGISVYAPEAARKIRTAELERSDEARLAGRESGLDTTTDLTVKGAKASRLQIRNGEAVLDVCADLSCTRRQMIMTLQAAIGEDLLHNSKMKTATRVGIDNSTVRVPLNSGSVGLFQQIAAMGWPASNDIRKDTTAFVNGVGTNIGLKQAEEDAGEDAANWEIIAAVQRPRSDLRQSTYDPWEDEATKWVDAYNPGERGASERTFAGRYSFSTRNDSGEVEDFWTTIKRLMDEVQWAAFAQQNRLWLVREAYLTTRRPAMVVDPDTTGVEDIDFDWNVNKEDATAQIICNASKWKAPAGTPIILKGLGFDDTRWLVETIGRSALDPLTTIDVRTAQHSLPEPAAKLISVSTARRGREVAGSDVNGLPAPIAAAYREAQKIDGKRYSYSWGGGHEHAGSPSRHPESSRGGRIVLGYDCSGSTAAVLAAAEPLVEGSKGFGLPKKGDSVPASGEFGLYGVLGEGKYMTWWYNGTHVFLEFKRPNNKDSEGNPKVEHFGTGRFGKEWGGAGFNSELHSHAGFTPAHIPAM